MLHDHSLFFFLIPVVPLLSLLAAFAIALHVLSGKAVGDEGETLTTRISTTVAGIVLLLLLFCDVVVLLTGAPGLITIGQWFASSEFVFPLSFAIDGASLALATGVAFIGWVTIRFSVHYLHREAGFQRFFLVLGLFLCGMQVVVLAGNGLLAFVGWEFCGVSSYLLIGYAYERPTATDNALFAFVANRIGDAGFLMGLFVALTAIGTTDWHSLALWVAAPTFDKVTARLMVLGFLIAALAKSAQLPFVSWIARALEGPTPSSAIFYGAVMVHAGVWLVIRLEPVLTQLPDILRWIAGIGLLTAVYAWIVGLVQTDVKSVMMFATTTQVGLMFFECGMGWFTVATWHLGLHALWRSWQFLMIPSYMHLVGVSEALAAPAWLARRQGLWTAALQRFWLDAVALALLARPLVRIGYDLRDFDTEVVARIIGMRQRTTASDDLSGDAIIRGYGAAGGLLAWCARHFQSFERWLILGDNAWLRQVLRETGVIFLVVEELLEQPRYLLMFVVATLAVVI